MINLGGLQAIANSYMTTPVTIRHRSALAKDPTNPTGDDVSGFGVTTTSVMGWFVDKGTRSFTTGGGMGEVVDEPTLRLPVGTVVGPRDEITINGVKWVAVDAAQDETWAVMLKVGLTRVE